MGKVRAICVSEKRGVGKTKVEEAVFCRDFGIMGDAHAGKWHRQVSLLSKEAMDAFKKAGAEVSEGDFGENLVVEGFNFKELPVGTLLRCGDVLLEISQIGKECHNHCAIYRSVGHCIMPREGVFAIVREGGRIHVGDEMTLGGHVFRYPAAVITLSDKGAAHKRKDESGPLIREMLEEGPFLVTHQYLLPDEPNPLSDLLRELSDGRKAALILTTGGTGFSKRDLTPEATMAVAERNVPGIAEAIRSYSMGITPRAMLGRGVSVLRKETLIINLPGSPKAVRESLAFILPTLRHGLDILTGHDGECGRSELKTPQ